MTMQLVLFLQDLGVERRVVRDLILEAGLPFAPTWEDWRRVESPERVRAVVTVKTIVDDHMFDRFPNAHMIAVAFTGFDCVDLDACRRRDIAVYNVPSYSTDSVAELTLGLTICLMRDIPRCDRLIRRGGWKLDSWGTELTNKVVGILGTGAIGLRVAELFKAFKCKLIGWSRTERKEFTDLGGTYLPREQVLSEADVVSIHLPLSKDTEGIVGERELGLMKPGACLINTARGRVVDKAALARVLQERRIRAALDVFDQEPIPPDDPLIRPDDTVLTPHIAFKTSEALQRRARITVQNIRAFLNGNARNRIA
ncbi:MAG: NAD(P)-dependent oxidoreductase [Phycisphaerae bacterium]